MIRWIEIRNFQRHKRLKLRLDKHVTTIVGENDAGKSAVMRALSWVLLNRPRGTRFIRHGAKTCSVKLTLTDGTTIKRTRGKGGNHYYLDGKRFTAFGNEVPAEIQRVLHVSDLNVQTQSETKAEGRGPAFWFALPPAEVSRRLNAIVDLSVIDSTLANLGTMSRKTRAELEVVEDRVVEAKAEVERTRLPNAVPDTLAHLERLEARIAKRRLRASALRDLLLEATSAQRTARKLAQATAGASALAKLEALAKRLADKRVAVLDLANRLHVAKGYKRERCECQNEAKRARKQFKREMGDTCELCGSAVPPS